MRLPSSLARLVALYFAALVAAVLCYLPRAGAQPVTGPTDAAVMKSSTGNLTANLSTGNRTLTVASGGTLHAVAGSTVTLAGTVAGTPTGGTLDLGSLTLTLPASPTFSGTWSGAQGGTGVANTGKTITLGGNLTTSGAFGVTLTLTGTTAITLPISGTLSTLAGTETLSNKTVASPTVSGNLTLGSPNGTNYIFTTGTSAATGSIIIQPGAGSAGFGGAFIAYSHSHPTSPGWVRANISASSGGKFAVNDSALGATTDVFTIDGSGNVTATGNATVAGRMTSGNATINNTLTTNRLVVDTANSTNAVLNIAAWGDSMTSGTGGTSYPTTLQDLLLVPVYNGGVGGETSSQIATRMIAATAKYGNFVIIWAGRNDVLSSPAPILANIASMVAACGTERYLVLGITNSSLEPSGSSAYNDLIAFNASLAAAYGPRYIDIRSHLISLWDPNVAQDVTDRANDVPPSSLRSDTLHLNSAGYNAVARRIAAQIRASLQNSVVSSLNISGTASATTSTTGAFQVGNGVAATNVAIGGGNINAGGSITGGSTLSLGSTAAATSPTSGPYKFGSTASISGNSAGPIYTSGDFIMEGATAARSLAIRGANVNAFPNIGLSSGYGGGSQQTWTIASNLSGSAGEFLIRDSTAGANALVINKSTLATVLGGPLTIPSKTAPSAPANGWTIYVDSGDGNKLKAIASTGTVVTLGTP